MDVDKINEIEKNGKLYSGKRLLLRFLRGEKLTRTEAVKAHCYDCSGYFIDGMSECTVECPLKPYSGITHNIKKGEKS